MLVEHKPARKQGVNGANVLKRSHQGGVGMHEGFGHQYLCNLRENTNREQQEPFNPSGKSEIKQTPNSRQRQSQHGEVNHNIDRRFGGFQFGNGIVSNTR